MLSFLSHLQHHLHHLHVLLTVGLDELRDRGLHLRGQRQEDWTLEEGLMHHQMLDVVVEDTRLDGGDVAFENHRILIFGAVGLLHVGGDAQVLLRVFAERFVHVGGDGI